MISHPDIIKAALTADALSLGPHWIYDQSALASAYPEGVDHLSAPLSKYHPGKSAGDFTHYGDNLVLMLTTAAEEGEWDPPAFASRWQRFWSDTSSYSDGATRKTLARLDDPSLPSSASNDIAGASIALVLTGLIGNAENDVLIDSVRKQTAFAHNDDETIDASAFFTRAIAGLRTGNSITESLEEAASAAYETLDATSELNKAKAALTSDTPLKVAAGFGLTCHTPDAFPLILYFLLRHPTDIATALSENALAGGDNAARAIIIAVVLTAANGWDSVLDGPWQSMNQRNPLEAALAS